MDKTINMIIQETKQNLLNVINESNLPISISSLILENLYVEVKKQEQVYITRERDEYEMAVASLENQSTKE